MVLCSHFLDVIDVVTWQDSQAITIISSIPDVDRFEIMEDRYTVQRCLNCMPS